MLAPSPNPWRRDFAALLRLTGPVAAARLGIMAMGLTDTLVVGRYSSRQLGFLGLGWTLPAVAMVAAMGFLSGVQVMTARYLGQGRPDLTGGVLRRGLGYALGLGVLAGGGLILAGPGILSSFHMAPGLAQGAAPAMRIFAASIPSILLATCAGLYLEATGRAGIGMGLTWAANGVNLALDLMLVPGVFGLPALGAAGAACGTLGARTFLAIALLVCIFRSPQARAQGLFDPPRDGRHAAREQRRLGYGAGVSQLVESAAFSGMNVIAGLIGALTVAGWSVVLNLGGIVFMAPLGLSTATAVLVGRAYGARDPAAVRRAAMLGFLTAAAYGAVAAVLAWLFRAPIAAAYSSDPALIALLAGGLALTGLFLCPDAIQVVAAQGLRARGDVLAPTLTHIASYALVMLPLGWLLAVKEGLGLVGCVLAVVVASWMSAGLLLGRFWLLGRKSAP
jgi:MATE family multidrug resistance protein